MQTNFYQTSKEALSNVEIFRQHRKVMGLLAANRKRAIDETHSFEEKRNIAHKIRLNALNNLPNHLEEFEKQATKNGMNVHWAHEIADANQIVLEILRRNNAERIIKGKSMVSEEMHLNHFLEEHGFEVIESDLGELIVQIANEAPSHIIAPAIHKNTRQIAQDFHQKLGMEYSEEIPDLILFARNYMRDKYLNADVGISGVNFAIAETGSLCLVENEGNGRYTTTIPKIHIAIMSLDKLIPHATDLPILLELLTKSATGQKITSYVNIISSARPSEEKDGPEQVHVIILNNGRTNILKDRLLRETLKCIRCGACINNCPIYVNIGGHAYNSIIPGPIGKILMPQIYGFQEQGILPTASSLCGACVDVCPVKIPITKILLKLREKKAIEELKNNAKSISPAAIEKSVWKIWALIYSSPLLYFLQRKKLGFLNWMLNDKVPVLKNWMKYRSKPKISKITLSELAKHEGFYEK